LNIKTKKQGSTVEHADLSLVSAILEFLVPDPDLSLKEALLSMFQKTWGDGEGRASSIID
jgi:hypothetical protein